MFKQRLKFGDGGESPFWRLLDFLGIPKVTNVRAFTDLRWICKAASLQKWYIRSLRPLLRQQLRPSSVHSYGFKPACRTNHLTALVRQLLHIAASWGVGLLVALQDVETAFDTMAHEHIATSMRARGVSSEVTVAHLRELTGIKATIHLPCVGSTPPFDYSKGGKQGGIETPDEWNTLIDYLLEPLVQSWSMRGFGFQIETEDADVYIHHGIWCDNVVLFARDQVMLSIMIQEITCRFQEHGLCWKPSSLEVLPGGEFAGTFNYEFAIDQRGHHHIYNVVDEVVLLGERFDQQGSSLTSMRFRQAAGDRTFYKHRHILQTRGRVIPRIRSWCSSPATSAVFGCESWHLTADLLQEVQQWEYKRLRQMLRLRRRPGEGPESFNKRSASLIRKWFEYAGIEFCTHRILRAIHAAAWDEQRAVLPYGQNPLLSAREHRSQIWRETMLACTSGRKRRAEGIVHSRRGHRAAWEDPLCRILGSDWRSARRRCSSRSEWLRGSRDFIIKACVLYDIYPPPEQAPHVCRPLVDRLPAVLRDLPPHPDDACWDDLQRRLWIQVDCLGVAQVVNGEAVLRTPHLEPIFRRICRRSETLLQGRWKPRRDIDPYVIWSKREYNTTADYIVNLAMDSNAPVGSLDSVGIREHADAGGAFKVCVDGGLREAWDSDGNQLAAIGMAVYGARMDAHAVVG